MHLSSALKAAGHKVRLAVEDYEDVLETTRKFKPGIVAYSVLTGSQRYYFELNRRVKEVAPVFSVFGGSHATFFPEMIEEPGVDGICIGEGELAMIDLANALERGAVDPHIPNWWFNLDGETIYNEVRPYIADLDTLPLPDRDLVYQKDPITRRSKIKHFISGRGCPYDCSYCFNRSLAEIYKGKGKRFRQRSVDNMIAEIRYVKDNYPLEFVVFVDDTFVLSHKWLEEFAEKYPREIGIPFFANTRANLVTAEQVELLKQAGCHCASMGVETGNDDLRDKVLNRQMSREQIINAARLMHEGGLRFTTTNMVGLPTSTLADDFSTIELNAEIKPTYAYAMIYQPYPRTALGKFTEEEGLLDGTLEDIGELAWDHSILNFASEHKRQMENLQRFFAIAVEWRALIPLIRQLIKLPSNKLYWLIHKLWKGYAIARRVHPVKLSLRDYWELIRHFMRLRS